MRTTLEKRPFLFATNLPENGVFAKFGSLAVLAT
jgi:hypothetical protein